FLLVDFSPRLCYTYIRTNVLMYTKGGAYMMEFNEWSKRKKEQQEFAMWSNSKARAAQPASYDPPYMGVGESLRLGIERTQTAPKTPPQPTQQTPPQSQALSRPAATPPPQAKAPVTPTGQALRLGELSEPPQKPFTFSNSPKTEMPINRFSAYDTALLPDWQAKSGMTRDPVEAPASQENTLVPPPFGAYTNNWNIEDMDDATLSQLIEDYTNYRKNIKAGQPGGTSIFASPRPPKMKNATDPAPDFGSGGKSLSTLYDTGFVIGNMANLYDEDSYLVNGKELVEESMKSLAGIFAANDTQLMAVAEEMFDHFINGNGDDYESPILTQKVLEHPSTQNFIDKTMETIQKYLRRDGGDLAALKSDEDFIFKMNGIDDPNFNTEPDLFGGLTICLNGTWGYTVDIADYKFDGKNYSGTLRYTVYDHFGLDEFDISGRNWYKGAYAPFAAWYALQYYEGCEGKYKPFVTYMNFEVPFSGSID
ncbi:MAG TPA: DUF3289 family protein, partial [Candidatus Acidoferrum sp.]|nr:DUF3289 family protein [Candidatus Acidoferrum sp.]